MITEGLILAVVATIQAGWTAWLHWKKVQIETSIRNICKECEYEYTPRKENK